MSLPDDKEHECWYCHKHPGWFQDSHGRWTCAVCVEPPEETMEERLAELTGLLRQALDMVEALQK